MLGVLQFKPRKPIKYSIINNINAFCSRSAAFCSLSVAYYNPAITNVLYLYLHKRQVLKRSVPCETAVPFT